MSRHSMTLTVVKQDDFWEVLVDGEDGLFRSFETKEQAEAVAQKWRDVLANAAAREVQQ